MDDHDSPPRHCVITHTIEVKLEWGKAYMFSNLEIERRMMQFIHRFCDSSVPRALLLSFFDFNAEQIPLLTPVRHVVSCICGDARGTVSM
jgi:hypothetical protein